MPLNRLPKPEIMSPAGYWPQLQTAIEAGADAVYFGLNHFSARAKVGFTLSELPDVMATLHRRGVRGYLTFNTLIFDHEIDEAARTLAAIAEAGVDSIIVQDVGIARLAHQIVPELAIHGSTQMSVTSAEGVELARRFGVSRVVLARELSLDDVRAIRAATDCELELFVHGALCVSYSGQCFSSEAWGGRSANRGQCAQACRLPYDLLVDGRYQPLGDARYLLSPGDLYALEQIPEIVQIGVSALKIEGRYKDSDYVALTTHAYREAVDAAWAGMPQPVASETKLQLEQVYSRGLGPYFLAGTNHQTVVRGRAPRHRGVLVGQVLRVLDDTIILTPEPVPPGMALKPGDGVVFDAADWRSPEEREEGGRIYDLLTLRNGTLELRFGSGAVDLSRIRVGDLLWRTHDASVDRMARPFTEPSSPLYRRPIYVVARAIEGQPLELCRSLVERPEITTTLVSPEPLGAARQRPVDAAYLREQLGRLGGTPYYLEDVRLELVGSPFAASSLLNQMRREAVERLQELAVRAAELRPKPPIQMVAAARATASQPGIGMAPLQINLHLLVRTPDQLAAAIAVRPASITLDYLELYGLRPAVEQVQAAGIAVRVASPRVLKPSEQRIVRFLLKLGCDAILVRSGGLLQALMAEEHPALIGDFSLNTANLLTADTFLRLGLVRLTPTHDLNAAQIAALAEQLGPARLEVIAYQHLPVFHTEHCVFCRFLSNGTSYKDCGHPCEQHRIALRDKQGRAHPVMADVGCRNTVFGAEAQDASQHLADWRAAGIGDYRLEFVHESAEQVRRIAEAWADALAMRCASEELTRRIQRAAPQGTTEGSLFVPENYLAIPLMQ